MCMCACMKGIVEAGSERPINISWTPPAGHEVTTCIHARCSGPARAISPVCLCVCVFPHLDDHFSTELPLTFPSELPVAIIRSSSGKGAVKHSKVNVFWYCMTQNCPRPTFFVKSVRPVLTEFIVHLFMHDAAHACI